MKHSTPLTRLKWIPVLALLLLCAVGVVSAKYVTTIEKNPMTVTFSVKLAESVILQEHKVSREPDGKYSFTETIIPNDTEQSQTYKLIPGLDIPKDPHVVITNKTDVPAYLYIEIVDTLDTATVDGTDVKLVDYSLLDHWESTDKKASQHGGTMYVYTAEGQPAKLIGTTEKDDFTFNILVNDKVTVSQHVKHADTDGSDVITIYAYLVEAVD